VRRSGHLIWLRADTGLCLQRAATGRPLLAGDPAARMAELAAGRVPLYWRLADGVAEVVPGLTPQQLAAQVAAIVSALEAQRAHH
jgi:shikimate kinase